MLKSYEKSFGEGRLFTWPPRVATCTFAYRFKCEPSKKGSHFSVGGGHWGWVGVALLIATTLAANGGKYFRCLGTLVSRGAAREKIRRGRGPEMNWGNGKWGGLVELQVSALRRSSSRSCWLSLNDFVSFFCISFLCPAFSFIFHSSPLQRIFLLRFSAFECGGGQSYRVLPVWHLQTATDWERVIKIKAKSKKVTKK